MAALMAVSDQQADAAIYDAPIMRYLLAREYQDHIEILPQEFSRQNYAIGLPADSADQPDAVAPHSDHGLAGDSVQIPGQLK